MIKVVGWDWGSGWGGEGGHHTLTPSTNYEILFALLNNGIPHDPCPKDNPPPTLIGLNLSYRGGGRGALHEIAYGS